MKKTIKITIYAKVPYSITREDAESGELKTYEGFTYAGVDEKNKALRFNSLKGDYKVHETDRYAESNAVQIELFSVLKGDGRLTWRDYEADWQKTS